MSVQQTSFVNVVGKEELFTKREFSPFTTMVSSLWYDLTSNFSHMLQSIYQTRLVVIGGGQWPTNGIKIAYINVFNVILFTMNGDHSLIFLRLLFSFFHVFFTFYCNSCFLTFYCNSCLLTFHCNSCFLTFYCNSCFFTFHCNSCFLTFHCNSCASPCGDQSTFWLSTFWSPILIT